MFDVFYIGKKPNVFVHEKSAESIQHAQEQSRTRYFWIINYLSDYTEFDFLWEPPPWQAHQRHAWASQWQKDSGTYLIPRLGHKDTNYHKEIIPRLPGHDHWIIPTGIDSSSFDFSWHPDPTDPPYIYQFGTQHQRTGGPRYVVPGTDQIKFVDQIRTKTQRVASAIIEIDHMDGNAGQIPGTAKISRYFDNYLDTLRRIIKNLDQEHEFVWICSSICDYKNFDFSWHPDIWQSTMLHVFASDGEKFGDTFFMHVPTFRHRSENCKLLEWYDLNFVEGVSVPRRPMPIIRHDQDSQVDIIKQTSWDGPLALFTDKDYVDPRLYTVPLWREETKTVVPLDAGGATVVVPKVAVPYIKTQVYDYPHIDKTRRYLKGDPLDIVFISNGEHGADHHWEYLRWAVQQDYRCPENRMHRVDGVNGRVAAYQAAAQMSQTDWFFAVFAKLQVNEDFDWDWQPDRMQQSKHYIFHAYNPVNHLTYGHQAMIAYNRRLVLANTGEGLDFTLDQEHEVVPIISGTTYYDNDPWTCWRTAFREVLKLRHSLPDVENEYRLNQWLNVGEGVNGHWSTRGARDAMNYYDQVNGDFAELKKSYEWNWLASYAMMLHPALFTNSNT